MTSPPYKEQRRYGSEHADWQDTVCRAFTGISDPRCQVLVNLGMVHSEGEVDMYWDKLICDMRSCGWRFFAWYVWDQLSGLPGNWSGRLAPSFEFVFHFNKQACAVNRTKPTSSWELGRKLNSTGLRNKQGIATLKAGNGKINNQFKVPDNVIRTFRELSNLEYSDHPARFPEQFACELIEPFSNQGDVVVDPFMGSGTTGAACIRLGRRFVGIEIEPKYFSIACRRIESAVRQPDLFIKQPPPLAVAEQQELPL